MGVSRSMDREKVIKGLSICSGNGGTCRECPYIDLRCDCDTDGCTTRMAGDALALLKEQVRPKGSWDYGTECSICHKTIIPPKDRTVKVYFCPWCGADMRQWYGE